MNGYNELVKRIGRKWQIDPREGLPYGFRRNPVRPWRRGGEQVDPRESAGYGIKANPVRQGHAPVIIDLRESLGFGRAQRIGGSGISRRPEIMHRDMLSDEFTDSWRTLTGSAKPQIAPPQQTTAQGFGSWFGNLLRTGLETVIQVKGQSEIEKMKAKAEIERQRALVSSYGDPRTLQAYSALEMQRQLEAQQRGLEADRIGGVTAPFMSGSTPWILGGVALLGVLLLSGRK